MISPTIDQELREQLEQLSATQQCEVLNFARFLVYQASHPHERRMGLPGKELLKFAGTISEEDAAEMLQAIEEGCGHFNPDDWK